MEIVISVASKIAEYTVAPVGQWLSYSCYYNRNIENLKNQEKNLQDAKNRVQHSVDAALRNGDEIEDDVKTWLREVYGITKLATKILREGAQAETRSSHSTCLNLKQRHQLSREAKKIARKIVEHLQNRNFYRVSYRPASQDHLVSARNKNYVTLESRTFVVNEILKALGDANINKIGVWGMPGVGKSTLMKEIERRAKEEKLFHGVVLTVVTKIPELSRIRGEIAVMRNQDQFRRQQTEIRRGDLEQESSRKKGKMLVILDDIWNQLDLEDVGIPSEGCKVVLTSRNRDVLERVMGTQKNFELKSLGEIEGWNLFEKMMGDSIKDPDVRQVAIKVAKECAGLPVALTTVSKALNGKGLSIWKDAELRLKRPPLLHVPEILIPVYSCMELSYNHLADEEIKTLFLLCALLGRYIHYKDLLKYVFGLGLFEGIITLEETRHRLNSLICNLQDSCLLLETSSNSRVFYMHDVVHDVATIIASKNRNMFVMRDEGGLKAWPDVDSLKRYEAFSVLGGDIDQLPEKMECPALRVFHVYTKDRVRSLQIPDSLFQGMDNLDVLDLTKMRLSSLPSSLIFLRNLRTLCLDQSVLGDISGIGELKNLEILSLLCSDISKLPREVGLLVHLRLLDLSNCSKLEMIPPNVLSRLVKLEELYMGNSFVQWESEGINNEREKASLAELNHLPHLTTLEIQIPDTNKVPADLLLEKLERYIIFIGDVGDWLDSGHTSRTLKLKFNPSFQPQPWVKLLWKRAEDLHLDELHSVESIIPEIDRDGFQQLKHLHIQNSAQLKYILNLRTSDDVFPTLETFVLKNMISLEEICHRKLPLTSFKNLRVLNVISCAKLRYVFSSSIVRGLPLLEELEVRKCNNMVAIVVKEEEQGLAYGDMILFRRLQTLVLEDIPKLVSFLSTITSFVRDGGEIIWEGNHDPGMPLLHDQVALPNLKILHLDGLPKITHVWSTNDSQITFMFQNLEVVNAWRCESLKSLFPAPIVRCLEQLKEIVIVGCGMEEIIATEGQGEATVARSLVFPRVICLHLVGLPRLKWFSKGMCISEWPMLETLLVIGCEKIEILAASGLVRFQDTIRESPPQISCTKQPFFLVDEMSFRHLETLHIVEMDRLEIIWHDQVAASSFSNVHLLSVLGCQNLLHIFQSNLLTITF